MTELQSSILEDKYFVISARQGLTSSTSYYPTTSSQSTTPSFQTTTATATTSPISIGESAAAVCLIIVVLSALTSNFQSVSPGQRQVNALAPVTNESPYFVTGFSWPSDGCADFSVRFSDGRCYPALKRGPCPDLQHVVVDPDSLMGTCKPRLCGRERVFLASDGLCHDIYDALECSGGRRLYYTAYGDPICDCPIGQYPFPGPQDNCVKLFTQGPCPRGFQVGIAPTGNLSCVPAQCRSIQGESTVVGDDGQCHPLGSRGPCSNDQLLGFDVFLSAPVCTNISDPESPYFTGQDELELLDRVYNQKYLFDEVQLTNAVAKKKIGLFGKKQGLINTQGLFVLPGALTEPLLVPCRAGARNGNNYKCANPLVPFRQRSSLRQAVKPAYNCRLGEVLTASAVCRRTSAGANCGPSYQFNSITGQCRQSLGNFSNFNF